MQKGTVTPHVGVWIETVQYRLEYDHSEVTPHVGVWIETEISRLRAIPPMSHLM